MKAWNVCVNYRYCPRLRARNIIVFNVKTKNFNYYSYGFVEQQTIVWIFINATEIRRLKLGLAVVGVQKKECRWIYSYYFNSNAIIIKFKECFKTELVEFKNVKDCVFFFINFCLVTTKWAVGGRTASALLFHPNARVNNNIIFSCKHRGRKIRKIIFIHSPTRSPF